MPKLYTLDLSSNQISGQIPLVKQTSLLKLYLRDNGISRELTDELIEGLSNISELHLTGNKQLTGSISTRYSFIILGIYH